ncbi:MAG: hypothetical protein MK335_00470 [Gemmatimonadetes bacterium]|nr:hypothetical protein [Gemmatimonadota bacterium]
MTTTFDACRISSASLDPASAPPTLVWETIDVSDGFTVRYPAWPGDAAELLLGALREAGARLAEVPAQDLVDCVGRVADRFLDSSDPLRQEAIDLLVPTAGISKEMASEILTGMARDWTAERLTELLRRELRDPGVLDGFRRVDEGRSVRAKGPLLTFHVGAGTVPGVGVTSMIRALLMKSAVLLKPGLGDVVLPVLFAEAFAEEAPELSDAVAVTYWPGGSSPLEGLALQRAEAVVVYGSDEVVSWLRARTPVTARFISYHHRLSLGMVGREALTAARAPDVARMAARAVSMFDQRGCVSPHAIYVEEGGAVDPGEWAALLASAMADLEVEIPGGYLTAPEASAVHQVRGSAELREASGGGVRVFRGDESFWTVILEDEMTFTRSCLNRVVSLVPTPDLGGVAASLGMIGRHLQTVAIEGAEDRLPMLAEDLCRAGATRVTSFEKAPWPPPWWRHDGASVLAGLVRWIDLEGVDLEEVDPAGPGD